MQDDWRIVALFIICKGQKSNVSVWRGSAGVLLEDVDCPLRFWVAERQKVN